MATSENGTYRISDEIWEQIKPLLPPEPPEHKSGRPRMDNRKAMEVIFYMLRTEVKWKDIEAESPVYERFQEWCRTGVFDRMWQVGILTYTWIEYDLPTTETPDSTHSQIPCSGD